MPYRLITFDVYSALVDLDGSLVPRIEPHVGEWTTARTVLGVWRRKQLEGALISNSLGRGHVPFVELTRRALDYAVGRSGVRIGAGERDELVAAWTRLSLWPEAEEVIGELKARGHPIAVLSNGDEAMLRSLLEGRLAFDHVFAADQAGVYKPDPAIYRLPLGALGLRADEVLHVAGSATDTMGAKAAGLACAWSNRDGDRLLDPALRPDFEMRDLRGLLDVV